MGCSETPVSILAQVHGEPQYVDLLAQSPAAFTTLLHLIVPALVFSPVIVAREEALLPLFISIASTATPWTMLAPCILAPLASAMHTSAGEQS